MNRIHACDKNSKNCVSTFNQEKSLHIQPAPYTLTEAEAVSIMKELLQSMDRVSIEEEESVYIRCIFQTRWLKFKDDVEIWFDAEKKEIHIKSSSRTGYSDFGVNRRRAEQILKSFQEKEKQHV